MADHWVEPPLTQLSFFFSIKRASCSTLVECGAVCDKQDNSGLTALHVACYHGAKEATRVLLAKKASVATADKMVERYYCRWELVTGDLYSRATQPCTGR